MVSPERVSRSQRGSDAVTAPDWPAVSPVKLSCIRTPWSAVTIIAAYAEPGWVLSLMMIPALAHGTRPGLRAGPGPFPDGIRPVSDVTRTVMLPLPDSG